MHQIRTITRLVAVSTGVISLTVAAAGPPPALDRGPTSQEALDAVRSTFVPIGEGLGDDRPKIAGRDVGVVERQHPDWHREPALIPAALQGLEHPEYYVYDGRPVLTPVDPTRLAVRMGDPGADAREAATAAGVATIAASSTNFNDWIVLDLAGPAASAGEVDDAVRALSSQATVDFASPVFETPDLPGGWQMMTRRVLARVQPEFLGVADAIIADAAPDLTVIERDVAGLPGTYRLESDAISGFAVLAAANRLALDPRLAWSEPEFVGTMKLSQIPNDPNFDLCWGLQNTGQQGCCAGIDMNIPAAWDITVGEWYVRVLVLDTGVDQSHPDINQLTGRDFTDGTPGGFGDGSPLAACDDHGTPVAGIIAGRMNNELGGVGVAPNSRVLSARIAAQDVGPCSNDWAFYSPICVANALNWGYNQGCVISNSSWNEGVSAIVQDAFDDTWLNGMLHFASTGNEGDMNINFPPLLASVHAVGSIDPDGDRSSFSTYGTGMGYVAPGNTIWSTDRTGTDGYANGDYVYFTGTSAASPMAAGAAALIWSALPDYSSTVIDVHMRLGCTDLGPAGYDEEYGWGLPNPRASLDGFGPFNNFCANPWPILSPTFNPAPFDTSQATAFPGEPQEWCELGDVGVSNSVWFAFFSPCDAIIDINTNGSGYDTVLSLYAGDCNFAWPIACDDDGGIGLDSQLLDVPVAAGTLYAIKVADYDTTPGGGQLDFNFVYRQPNDDCGDAIEIAAGSTEFCTVGATDSADPNPACAAFDTEGIGTDVWFTHVATQTGDLTISTCGSADYDTKLAVYAEGIFGGWCPAPLGAQIIGCSDDAPGCADGSSEVTVAVEAGTIYTIRIGGDTAGSGNVFLSYEGCAGDVDGDGIVDVNDLLDVLSAWGTADPDADLSDDGVVDVTDMLIVLGGWGACP